VKTSPHDVRLATTVTREPLERSPEAPWDAQSRRYPSWIRVEPCPSLLHIAQPGSGAFVKDAAAEFGGLRKKRHSNGGCQKRSSSTAPQGGLQPEPRLSHPERRGIREDRRLVGVVRDDRVLDTRLGAGRAI